MKKTVIIILSILARFAAAQTSVAFPDDSALLELGFDRFSLVDYLIGPQEEYGYWYATVEDVFNVSVLFMKTQADGGAQACREYFTEKLKANSRVEFTDEYLYEIGDSAVHEYQIRVYNNKKVNQKHLNVYLAAGAYWIDVHLSKILYDDIDKRFFYEFLHSVRVVSDYVYDPLVDMNYGAFYYQSGDYARSIFFYRRAESIPGERVSIPMKTDQRRLLLERLGMSYFLSGDTGTAKTVFTRAIAEDGAYPMFHYDLARIYAGEDDLDACLETLSRAVELKTNMDRGQKFPDPAQDTVFEKYCDDAQFKEILKKLK